MILVMVDADILVEAVSAPKVFVRRYGDELWEWMKSPRIAGYVTPLGYDRIQKTVAGKPNGDRIVGYIRQVVEVCSVNTAILEAARALNWLDFEAAVEYLCAREMGLDGIVALNPSMFALQETPVYTIVELLVQMPLGEELDRYRSDFDRLLELCGEHCQPYLPVHLSRWFQDEFNEGWQPVKSLLDRELAMPNRLYSPPLQRGKMLDFGAGDRVALVMGIKHLSAPQADVWVELLPDRDRNSLPDNIQLDVLDEEFNLVMQAEYQNTSHIRLKFTADRGDYFSLKIRREDSCLSEHFLV